MNPVLPVVHHVEPQDLSEAYSSSSQVMGRPSRQGIYWGNDSWFRDNEFSWFPDKYFKGQTWQFGKPEHRQTMKLTNKITGKVSIKPDRFEKTGQASAVYDAQILKNNQTTRSHIIVKIFMRIPSIPIKPNKKYVDKSDLLSKSCPIDEEQLTNECYEYKRESENLERLTQKRCSSTPKHIANFQHDDANPWIRDGYLCFVVMTKVPGRNVSDIWEFDPRTQEQRDEQHQIQRAFKTALLEVSHFGMILTDLATRNIIWNKAESKCYLIDFESCLYDEDLKPNTWAGLSPHLDHPDRLLEYWGLDTRELQESLTT